jgi:hypothetical protein
MPRSLTALPCEGNDGKRHRKASDGESASHNHNDRLLCLGPPKDADRDRHDHPQRLLLRRQFSPRGLAVYKPDGLLIQITR